MPTTNAPAWLTALYGAAATGVPLIIAGLFKKFKDDQKSKYSLMTAIEKAKIDQEIAINAAIAVREKRLDERTEAMFEQSDRRQAALEATVSMMEARLRDIDAQLQASEARADAAHELALSLRVELRTEREERKITDLTAQSAHMRAEEAEKQLAIVKADMVALTNERDALQTSCAEQATALAENAAAMTEQTAAMTSLNARVGELQSEITRLESEIARQKADYI